MARRQTLLPAGGLEPSAASQRTALAAIKRHVERARAQGRPIAWVRHHNRPNESPAFIPGSWGAEFSDHMGPAPGSEVEMLFEKDVFGAFTGTDLERWLRSIDVNTVLLVGFYAHMCLSTSAREALVRGFDVYVDPDATGSGDLEDPVLGRQTADEVRRTGECKLFCVTGLGINSIKGERPWPSRIPPTSCLTSSSQARRAKSFSAKTVSSSS